MNRELDGSLSETGSEPTATVDFGGETFRVRPRVGAMPLMRFAKAAQSEREGAVLDRLAAVYDMIRSCIVEDDWQRFSDTADRTNADEDDIFGVLNRATEAVAARPTQQPSDSLVGLSSTSDMSRPDSSSQGSLSRPVSHIREVALREGWPDTG